MQTKKSHAMKFGLVASNGTKVTYKIYTTKTMMYGMATC